METLLSTLEQMMFLFLCILAGYFLNRAKILPGEADVVISRLLSYVFLPALNINSFRKYCTPDNLSANAGSLFYSLLFLALSIGVAFLLAPRFARDKAEEGIFRYSIAIANFGFMGNSLVQGLLGDEALFHYLIYTLPLNVFVYSVGVIWVTAGKKKFSPGDLVNPVFFSALAGIVLGLTRLPLPGFAVKAVESCAGSFSPLAMILTGVVVAKFDLKALCGEKRVYVLTALRLVVIPLAFFLLTRALNVPRDIARMVLIASAMPLGLNTIVFPAAYGGDETLGASMAVISNVIGILTVPLVLSLVV